MASIINTNISSLTAQRNLSTNQASLASAMQRLSSGMRINSAKDDAAGLSISERMTAQIRGSEQAARNANDGISLSQTAEGDLGQISSNLQRMRELAVQAANATNSVSDRAALDGEVQALSAEIDRVSQNSAFNGVKLLDGSFTAQRFQVGANGTANDSVTINSIASTRTSQLGGVGTSFEASTTSGKTTAALSAGDLTLNGFQVGAATLGAAPGQSTASAYSIAAAINAVSSSSGVTATADTNTVTGTAGAITANTLIVADTFSINGINVGAIAAGTTDAGQGANVAAAINLIATQTGVSAKADAGTGLLTLTALDGRDIQLNATTPATKAALLTQTGLDTTKIGVQGTSVALGAYASLASATATDMVALTVDGLSLLANQTVPATAAQVATAMNTFTTANTGYTAFLTSTGASITGAVSAANITAGVTLVKADGSAVDVKSTFSAIGGVLAPAGATSGGFAGAPTLGTVVTPAANTTVAGTGQANNHGTLTLKSTSSDGIVYGGANAGRAGLSAAGAVIGASTTSSVSSIASMNVLTAANATKALAAIDGALSTVNSSRAALGAIQNRFTSVVTSLQTTSENLSASRSRIQDADFALETANLSRAQILQQAGTAMVAQANQLPQSVLSLLK